MSVALASPLSLSRSFYEADPVKLEVERVTLQRKLADKEYFKNLSDPAEIKTLQTALNRQLPNAEQIAVTGKVDTPTLGMAELFKITNGVVANDATEFAIENATKAEIEDIQQQLSEKGLYPPLGHSYYRDGDAGPVTLHAFKLANDPSFANEHMSTALKDKKLSDDDIMKIQASLNVINKGDANKQITVDGVLGNETRDAIDSFLKANESVEKTLTRKEENRVEKREGLARAVTSFGDDIRALDDRIDGKKTLSILPPDHLQGDKKWENGWKDFISHLAEREGFRQDVYKDSLGKPTVGYGHLITEKDGLKLGDTISTQQALTFLQNDATKHWKAAEVQARELGVSHDPKMVAALASVHFQMGEKLQYSYKNGKAVLDEAGNKVETATYKLLKEGKFEEAAERIGKWSWAEQTPVRVKDFQIALREASDNKSSTFAIADARDFSTPAEVRGEGQEGAAKRVQTSFAFMAASGDFNPVGDMIRNLSEKAGIIKTPGAAPAAFG